MKTSKIKTEKRARRKARIRAKVSGTSDVPRLSVFRSNKFMYAQLVDDEKNVTIAASSSKGMKGKMLEQAKLVGIDIAKKAKEKKIANVVFDRSGYMYTGKVQALADGAREGGLVF